MHYKKQIRLSHKDLEGAVDLYLRCKHGVTEAAETITFVDVTPNGNKTLDYLLVEITTKEVEVKS